MFDLITLNLVNSTRNIILNRSHLGEYVYSPIYRGYEGKWIFDLEESFLNSCYEHFKKIKLFVLYDSNNLQLNAREDGKSLSKSDNQKMSFERERFIKAYEKSKIPCKRIFDISNYPLNKGDKPRQITNLIIKLMLDL